MKKSVNFQSFLFLDFFSKASKQFAEPRRPCHRFGCGARLFFVRCGFFEKGKKHKKKSIGYHVIYNVFFGLQRHTITRRQRITGLHELFRTLHIETSETLPPSSITTFSRSLLYACSGKLRNRVEFAAWEIFPSDSAALKMLNEMSISGLYWSDFPRCYRTLIYFTC